VLGRRCLRRWTTWSVWQPNTSLRLWPASRASTRTASGFEQLTEAQERIKTPAARDAFAEEFIRAQGLFEFLWPDPALRSIEDDYKWLARIYKSVTPVDNADRLLWQRLGAKTAELIHAHLSDVTVDGKGYEAVAIDAEVFEALRQLKLFDDDGPEPVVPPTIEDVLDTLDLRLQRKLAGTNPHLVWISLAERLEALRQAKIDSAAASVEFLKQLLELAQNVVAAEKADHEGRLDDFEVVDPDRGALTQILREYAPSDTPAIIENVVEQIDEIVRPVRGTGWQDSQPGDREVRRQLRLVLKNNGLPPQGEIFDRAYAYISEHY
jgi:type I restriction enzyme, R subunit